eukprot:gene12519-8574_t
MGKPPPKWLPGERVKETILLQRKSVEQLRADRVLRRDKLKEQRDRRKAKIDSKRKAKLSTKKFISAQTILKHALRAKDQARKFHKIGEKVDGRKRQSNHGRFVEYLKNSYPVLIVRAKGNQIPTEVAAAFRSLGLEKLYSARLIVPSLKTHKLIKQLTPFSIIGHPDRTQVENLLRTRGALVNPETKTKRFISGNLMLEQNLGQYNILCIEDLADTIVERRDKVEEVLQHLAPFDFHPPRQLFAERHRAVHQKLEVLNKESFASYLEQQLQHTAKRLRRSDSKAKSSTAKKAATRRVHRCRYQENGQNSSPQPPPRQKSIHNERVSVRNHGYNNRFYKPNQIVPTYLFFRNMKQKPTTRNAILASKFFFGACDQMNETTDHCSILFATDGLLRLHDRKTDNSFRGNRKDVQLSSARS